MAIVETEGLILKSYSLSEADKIIVLLTRNEGLVRGVAKGAKRLKSRFGGSLEPFTIVNISYFQKEERELVSITQIELVKSFFASASDPFFLQKFAYLAELIVNFAPPHDPNEKLYRMAKICLETAVSDIDGLESIALYFELWVLKLGGYLPDWNVCNNCKNLITLDENSSLQSGFQLLCQNCQKSGTSNKVSAVQKRIFRSAQQLSPPDFVGYSADKPFDVREVSAVLKRIIVSILGKEMIVDKILSTKI